eukprot:TRINITY_DN14691_c0_g1_i1.p1 TRINITY_DN14691_c0_g1~~TRINITY_DN14691_c0_g1_i1.p1  ORF type:complete len:112 (+),score=26.30 TRINITY_DN14691_c0_g1_i1:379-714(+)
MNFIFGGKRKLAKRVLNPTGLQTVSKLQGNTSIQLQILTILMEILLITCWELFQMDLQKMIMEEIRRRRRAAAAASGGKKKPRKVAKRKQRKAANKAIKNQLKRGMGGVAI